MHGPVTAGAPRPLLAGAFVIVLVLAVYAVVLGGPFLWDDHALVLGSGVVTAARSLTEYFDSAFFLRQELDPNRVHYYRPLTMLTLALDYRLHGTNPGGYHLTNLLLHALATGLVFALILRRGAGVAAATAGALLFGWSPRLSEAAAWISGRTDLLATVFVLAALLLAAMERSGTRWAAALCLLLGMLAKEVAVAGLLGCATLVFLQSAGLPLRDLSLRLAPFVLGAAAYAGLRIAAIGAALSANGLALGERGGAALEALGRYAFMLLDPWHPALQIGFLGARSLPFLALGAGVLAACLLLLLRLRRRRPSPLLGAALVTLAASLALVLHVVPIPVNVVAADRFLYLPLAALAVALVPWLSNEARALARRARVAQVVALAALVASFGIATSVRAADWSDEVALWSKAYFAARDSNTLPRLELGNVYLRAGLHERALALFLSAEPNDRANRALALNNAGKALLLLGRQAEAERVLTRLVEEEPGTPKFRVALAAAYSAEFRFDAARAELEAALALHPGYDDARAFRDLLPGLEREAHTLTQPPSAAPEERLRQARLLARLERHDAAFRSILSAFEPAPADRAESERTLIYALQAADPATLARLVRSHQKRHPETSPALAESLGERFERVRRLESLWPTLGVGTAGGGGA